MRLSQSYGLLVGRRSLTGGDINAVPSCSDTERHWFIEFHIIPWHCLLPFVKTPTPRKRYNRENRKPGAGHSCLLFCGPHAAAPSFSITSRNTSGLLTYPHRRQAHISLSARSAVKSSMFVPPQIGHCICVVYSFIPFSPAVQLCALQCRARGLGLLCCNLWPVNFCGGY